MSPRPSARVLVAAGVIALATVLSSCGFNYATDREYTPAAGSNDQDASVDVLGAVVVSAQDGSGTFIASFANNSQDNDATVLTIAGAGEDADVTAADFSPIVVPPAGLVNLATDGGVALTGDQVTSGAVVDLTIGLANGENVDLSVPVVPPCHEFEGLDESGDGSLAESNCAVESLEPHSEG